MLVEHLLLIMLKYGSGVLSELLFFLFEYIIYICTIAVSFCIQIVSVLGNLFGLVTAFVFCIYGECILIGSIPIFVVFGCIAKQRNLVHHEIKSICNKRSYERRYQNHSIQILRTSHYLFIQKN